MASTLKGFYVFQVETYANKRPHYVFFKKHDVKGEENETNDISKRSIFFCNLPINTTAKVLKKYLQNVCIGATLESFTQSALTDSGEDEWVDLSRLTSDLELNKPGVPGIRIPKNCGIATFVDKAAFQLAFSKLKNISISSTRSEWPLKEITDFGSVYFLAKYKEQILNPDELYIEVSESLADFERAEKESIEQLQQQSQLVDEDGFTLVVDSHRKTKAGIMGRQRIASTVEASKAENKLKKKEKDDFYRFQLRQRKKEEMNELLHKFKLDQEKVRLMKERKKFKPYVI